MKLHQIQLQQFTWLHSEKLGSHDGENQFYVFCYTSPCSLASKCQSFGVNRLSNQVKTGPWRVRQQVPPKLWYLAYTKIYDVTNQNTVILESSQSVLKLNDMKVHRMSDRDNLRKQNFCKIWRSRGNVVSSTNQINTGYLNHQYLGTHDIRQEWIKSEVDSFSSRTGRGKNNWIFPSVSASTPHRSYTWYCNPITRRISHLTGCYKW